jgi:hypothetical protein
MEPRMFLVNAVLLATHEVDSGCWREWELFGLPGGAGLFVLLHLGIFALLFWGYGQLLAGTRAGQWMSGVVAASAVLTVGIHGMFLALGSAEFRSAVSLGILGMLGVGGVVHCVVLVAERRAEAHSQRC